MRFTKLLASAALALLALAGSASAASFTTYVGYADNLRASPFFPSPWCGSASVALFAGSGLGCSGGPSSGTQFDSGAVRIQNSGATDITINSIQVVLNGGGPTFDLWGSFLGATGFVLHAGQDAIFAQTNGENFDTSDFTNVGNERALGDSTPGNNPFDNCSVGTTAGLPDCAAIRPKVIITIDGVTSDLFDTAHVLDTGGFDTVNSNPCVGGNNANNNPGACNESLQWREIGTVGLDNPGGTDVPEPATLALLGAGLVGFGMVRRRKAA